MRPSHALATVSENTLRVQDHRVEMTYSKPLKPNLETILNDVNRFINIKSNRQLYATHFAELQKQIFAKLREMEPFGYIFKGYQLGGSYGDNLKVTTPNEFDLIFHFKFPDNHLIAVKEDLALPGNVHIDLTQVLHKIRNEKQHAARMKYFKQWVDKNNYLSVKALQAYFESCFHKTLQIMSYTINVNGIDAKLRYTKEGPAHTIHVTDPNNMIYSVDFVPGLLLQENQSVVPEHVGEWEAIPKPLPKLGNCHNSFRSSFYRQEQKWIDNKKNLKNALRIMKKFRDAHLNMHKMKSYFIKTLFLWKAKEKPGEIYWTSPLAVIIVDMFRAMEDSLKRGRLLFFWDPRLDMYENYSDSLIREMFETVQSARKTLEAASVEISQSLQRRVYAIFLTERERNQLCLPNFDQRTLDEASVEQEEPPQPETEQKSWCVIQ